MPPPRTISIKLQDNSTDWEIFVDGQDVTEECFAVHVQAAVGSGPPVVVLGILAFNELGNPYKNEEQNDVARRYLRLEPETVILEGEAAFAELVAQVGRASLKKRKI